MFLFVIYNQKYQIWLYKGSSVSTEVNAILIRPFPHSFLFKLSLNIILGMTVFVHCIQFLQFYILKFSIVQFRKRHEYYESFPFIYGFENVSTIEFNM